MPRRSNIRYRIRKNEGNAYWTVYDVVTGLPAAVNDMILDRCKRDEASDIADLMSADVNDREDRRRNRTRSGP